MSGDTSNPIAQPIQLAEQAARAGAEGRRDEARTGFSQALGLDPSNIRILFLAFQFHFRAGELDEAERLVLRRISAAGPGDSEEAARGFTNLGLIFRERGDLAAAERHMTAAVEMDERLGHDYGLSRDLGNLATVHEMRGELDDAEALALRALAIAERLSAEELIATKVANLGDIAFARGRVEPARVYWSRAVELLTRLGMKNEWRDEYARKLASLDSLDTPAAPGPV